MLACAKRGSKGDGFKVPAERQISAISSIDTDEEEKAGSSIIEDSASGSPRGESSHASRRYRGTGAEEKSRSG